MILALIEVLERLQIKEDPHNTEYKIIDFGETYGGANLKELYYYGDFGIRLIDIKVLPRYSIRDR